MSVCKVFDVPGGDAMVLSALGKNGELKVVGMGMDPATHQKIIDNIPDIKCRANDVFLMAFPKCGTHWVWELLTLIYARSPEVSPHFKGIGMLEGIPEEHLEKLPSPRILNTHLNPDYLPKEVFSKKLKIIFLHRNPKDVAVSLYHHVKGLAFYQYDGKFENFLQMFMRGDMDYGSYPKYLLKWQNFIRSHPDLPVHVVSYEDLQKDCQHEAKRLCEFIGEDLDQSLLENIVDSCQIKKLTAGKYANSDPQLIENFKKILKGGFTIYRKGIVGDWKNYFTVSMSEQFDTWWEEETRGLEMFKFTPE